MKPWGPTATISDTLELSNSLLEMAGRIGWSQGICICYSAVTIRQIWHNLHQPLTVKQDLALLCGRPSRGA